MLLYHFFVKLKIEKCLKVVGKRIKIKKCFTLCFDALSSDNYWVLLWLSNQLIFRKLHFQNKAETWIMIGPKSGDTERKQTASPRLLPENANLYNIGDLTLNSCSKTFLFCFGSHISVCSVEFENWGQRCHH